MSFLPVPTCGRALRLAGILTLLVLASTSDSTAQSGLSFLRVGPDAAHLALGDAGAAVVDGPFAAERNPAGLAESAGSLVALTHHVWIAGVRTYGAAARFNVGKDAGFGIYVRATGSGDIEARSGPGPASGVFEAQFTALGAAVARRFGAVRIGVGAKLLTERIFAVSATGVAFDAGIRVDLARGAVRLAGAYQNAGEMETLVQRSTRLPRTARAAVAVYPFRVLAMDDGSQLLEAFVTAEVSRDLAAEMTQVHLGVSVDVMETLRARVGYMTNDELRGASAGLGIIAGDFRVDYAVLPFSEGFGGPGHTFTLVYGL